MTSDTHFNHTNILKFLDKDGAIFRNFSSVEEMNETMVDRWNSVVRDGDIVYHLGDVYLGSGPQANVLLGRLRGRKRLVLGNHDNGKDQLLLKFFQKITVWRMWPDLGIVMTHVPILESSFRNKCSLNVHGHIHQNDSPPGPYRNVCVEKTGYTPVHIEELRIKT